MPTYKLAAKPFDAPEEAKSRIIKTWTLPSERVKVLTLNESYELPADSHAISTAWDLVRVDRRRHTHRYALVRDDEIVATFVACQEPVPGR